MNMYDFYHHIVIDINVYIYIVYSCFILTNIIHIYTHKKFHPH